MEELDFSTWTSWSPLSDSTNRLTGQIVQYFVDFVLVYRSVVIGIHLVKASLDLMRQFFFENESIAVGIGRHHPFFDCL